MNTIHFDTVGVFLCGILLSKVEREPPAPGPSQGGGVTQAHSSQEVGVLSLGTGLCWVHHKPTQTNTDQHRSTQISAHGAETNTNSLPTVQRTCCGPQKPVCSLEPHQTGRISLACAKTNQNAPAMRLGPVTGPLEGNTRQLKPTQIQHRSTQTNTDQHRSAHMAPKPTQTPCKQCSGLVAGRTRTSAVVMRAKSTSRPVFRGFSARLASSGSTQTGSKGQA